MTNHDECSESVPEGLVNTEFASSSPEQVPVLHERTRERLVQVTG